MSDQYWSWVVTIIGLVGFYFAGQKKWWSWYINIANQILWTTFAIVTEQWGFLLGVPLYLFVFIKNAYTWTKDHFKEPELELKPVIGRIISSEMTDQGLSVVGEIDRSTPEGEKAWARITGAELFSEEPKSSRFRFPRKKGSW